VSACVAGVLRIALRSAIMRAISAYELHDRREVQGTAEAPALILGAERAMPSDTIRRSHPQRINDESAY
jgi:hypothetical protein